MVCKKCKIDMRVEKVSNSKFYFKCVKCGKEEIKTEEELTKEYEEKNKKE